MKKQLEKHIVTALESCFAEETLDSAQLPSGWTIEVPGNPDHGDFASNVAMTMARAERKAPRKIAEILIAALGRVDGPWERIEIAGPGFINFYLKRGCWYAVLDQVLSQGQSYGLAAEPGGERIQVEFVSANPTGPLHIGHGRGAVVGDAVASLLEAAGHQVQREYYINDAGNQITLLGRSIWLRLREQAGCPVDFPEDGYQGEYIREVAASLAAEQPTLVDAPEAEAVPICSSYGVKLLLGKIEEDLGCFGIRFDNWYRESSLYERDLVAEELGKLKKLGLTFEKDGALWLRTTDYGDDKDRVLIRSDGSPTYFASDVAYHMEKFDRGFSRVIDVWGADHHGYVPRMKAMLAGLGREPEALQVLMIQMVNLLRGGEPVSMGKRSGQFVTLREVVDEVGRDACRFFFLMRRADSQLDFDLELAKQQSNDNPVYYVQYAHARICSINRNAAEQGLQVPGVGEADVDRLTGAEELALAKMLYQYPETLATAARNLEPHRVIYYLQDLAAMFHSYYNRCRVLGEDVETGRARLYLFNGVRQVLENALRLLGVSAPERM
ncbi:arginine--tRNA ligase [Geothermobacter hydrogeniphilus]|uniref:Arginine--tRNA ligase n=1 Tax=Geothermobacter hydrogeniphilus TaxID=1969733 RepID=A0A1X0YD75_9BACT|nr:arginine--tRNA ligase [Geothermobacter hydrogeniphilus]ORJ63052.1 arginine--tRNA ligase [Geothermobacter hydrogeniphilus]